MQGISRSATIMTAFIMHYKNYRLKEAFAWLKKCRPQVIPNPTFRNELVKYDRMKYEGQHEGVIKPKNRIRIYSLDDPRTFRPNIRLFQFCNKRIFVDIKFNF